MDVCEKSLNKDVKALLNLTPKSSREMGLNSPSGPAKHLEKPAQHVRKKSECPPVAELWNSNKSPYFSSHKKHNPFLTFSEGLVIETLVCETTDELALDPVCTDTILEDGKFLNTTKSSQYKREGLRPYEKTCLLASKPNRIQT
ncbi:hypothetical protein CR513_40169, partial [Mucuna pruriens]